jgi:hypothetical protein
VIRDIRSDDGNALVEFTFLAVLLLVPLTYLLLTVFQVQRAAYAATAATREAGRAFATAEDESSGYARAEQAVRIALADHGLPLNARELTIDCRPPQAGEAPGTPAPAAPCLVPGGRIHVAIDTAVPLPFLPRVLAGRAPASIAVRASHLAYVDEHRGVAG